MHNLFRIEVIKSRKTVFDDFAYKFTGVDTFIFHHVVKSPSW